MSRKIVTMYLLVILVSAGIAYAVHSKYEADYAIAVKNYKNSSKAAAQAVSEDLGGALKQIYQNMRTISLLPSVRKIDRHGENLDEDSLQSIRQIYNNIKSNTDVSEIYIVSSDFDPDKIDPKTGKTEAPILMFDELIIDSTKNDASESDEPEIEAVEKYEYQQLRDDAKWFAQHYPDKKNMDVMNLPLISGKPVITCDNSVFEKSRLDEDRAGIIMSVPFYDKDDKLKGLISVIIRSNAIRALMPDTGYAMVVPEYDFAIRSSNDVKIRESDDWVNKGEPSPDLIYSEVFPINAFNDPRGKWKMWAGLSNDGFYESEGLNSIRHFRNGGYLLALFILVAGFLTQVLLQIKERNIAKQKKLMLVQRKQALMEMADNFDSSVKNIVIQVVNASDQMQTGSSKMLKIAGDTKHRSSSVAEASGVSAKTSSHVAGMTEELTEMINEISRQAQKSSSIARVASEQAKSSRDAVTMLVDKSQKVGQIVGVINGIADKINLMPP